MGTEIERKFLVQNMDWKQGASGIRYKQGYLCTEANRTVRVRIAGQIANINIKGLHSGIRRREYEYPIPLADAEEILDAQCIHPLIEKIRYRIEFQGHTWEVDEFFGENQGLVVAEIELDSEERAFALPPWVGKEVSDDMRYTNASLNEHPFGRWPENNTQQKEA